MCRTVKGQRVYYEEVIEKLLKHKFINKYENFPKKIRWNIFLGKFFYGEIKWKVLIYSIFLGTNVIMKFSKTIKLKNDVP